MITAQPALIGGFKQIDRLSNPGQTVEWAPQTPQHLPALVRQYSCSYYEGRIERPISLMKD